MLLKALKQTIRIFGFFQGLLFFFSVKILKKEKHSLKPFKGKLYLRNQTTDFLVFEQVYLDQDYEFDFQLPINNIIDAGANIGLTSLYFSNKYNNPLIISIEPETNNFNSLKFNIKKYVNIHAHRTALWHSQQILTIKPHELGNWAFTTSPKESGQINANSDEIETITIPQIMELYQIQQIDILKIDIEGSERELFENPVDSWLPKVKYLIIEIHDNLKPGTTDLFLDKIKTYNFKITPKAENLILENLDLIDENQK